jgi:MerR family transcriptional regulator, Zn(II)-responsive regulator of zntA
MKRMKSTSQLRIGELAGELGLNPKTIRYYEQINLLPVPARTGSGYRQYTASDRERLRFILKAKAIGFTLEEIREILKLRCTAQSPCSHVLALLERKVVAVEAQLQALTEVRTDLLALRQEAMTTSVANAEVCGIIEQHQQRTFVA